MRPSWSILAGAGTCLILLVAIVLLARSLDPKVPVSAPGPALRTAASLTAAPIKVIPTGPTCPTATPPPGSGGAPIACRSR